MLEDHDVKSQYEKMLPKFQIAATLIENRLKSNLTQLEVATRMGTTQSTIARLESGQYFPSFKTLQKYAHAINREIPIRNYP